MLISPLQAYEPKDWSGLTTENHLGAMYAQEPQYISKVIEQLYKVNLGGDDIVSFLDVLHSRNYISGCTGNNTGISIDAVIQRIP